MMKLYRALVSAYYWIKSLSLSGKKEYAAALDALKKCEKYNLENFEFYLLYSFLSFSLGDFYGCIRRATKSIELLEGDKNLNKDEINYLNAYAIDLIELADMHGGLGLGLPDELSERLKPYNLENVSRSYKNIFPER